MEEEEKEEDEVSCQPGYYRPGLTHRLGLPSAPCVVRLASCVVRLVRDKSRIQDPGSGSLGPKPVGSSSDIHLTRRSSTYSFLDINNTIPIAYHTPSFFVCRISVILALPCSQQYLLQRAPHTVRTSILLKSNPVCRLQSHVLSRSLF